MKGRRADLLLEGCFVHSTNCDSMIIREGMVMGVRAGKIIFFEPRDKLNVMLSKYELDKENLIQLHGNQFIMPGFVDSHAHAAQYSFMGTGSDLELLPWLEKYTYPTEMRLSRDINLAGDVYSKCVNRTLRNGSTTVCYFATIDSQSSSLLADAVECEGQRAYIGKVNMDANSPDNYREVTQNSVMETRRFVKDTLGRKNPLVTPCVTPRFAISCSMELMESLGKIARDFDVPVQTHISENRSEIEAVLKMFPQNHSYTDVYSRAGLLGKKTILAHGVYLSDNELTTIKQAGSGVSHCPNSNFSLKSGILDVRRLIDAGVKVGLGTDFAGGHSPAILDAVRRGMTAANVLTWRMCKQGLEPEPITYKHMFQLATLGSAEVMGLADTVGNFEPGKSFDALLIDPDVENSPFDVFPTDSREDVVQKFLFLGDDRNMCRVFVDGVQVVGQHT